VLVAAVVRVARLMQLVMPRVDRVRLLLVADKAPQVDKARLLAALRVELPVPGEHKAVDKLLLVLLKHRVPKPGQQRRINLQI
jgi:hypothetical protein